MRDAHRHVAVHQLGFVHRDETDVLPGVGLVGANGAEGHAAFQRFRCARLRETLNSMAARLRLNGKGLLPRRHRKFARRRALGEPRGDPRRVVLAVDGDEFAHRRAKRRLGEGVALRCRRGRRARRPRRHRSARPAARPRRCGRSAAICVAVVIARILGTQPGEGEASPAKRLTGAFGACAKWSAGRNRHVRTLRHHPAARGGARLFRLSRNAQFSAALQYRADPADSGRHRRSVHARRGAPFPADALGIPARLRQGPEDLSADHQRAGRGGAPTRRASATR